MANDRQPRQRSSIPKADREMKRAGAKASGVLLAVVLSLAATGAHAQEGAVPAGYVGLPVKAYSGGQGGLLVGENARLHAGVGTEVGYDSNVFYQPSGELASALIRVVPFLDLTNQLTAGNNGGSGSFATGLFYDLTANLQFRHLFASEARIDDSQIRNTFSPAVSGIVDLSQVQHLGLSVSDSFSRTEDAPYQPGQPPIVRNGNQASLQLRWSPGGGRIQGILRYTNHLDLLEGAYNQDRSMTNEGLLDVSWRWFPKTALFASVQQGAIRYFDEVQSKRNSNPLRARIGLRGLVTEKVSAGLGIGYSNGFYSDSSTGFYQASGDADIVYRPTLMTSTSLSYRHDFQNSIIGHFYNVDMIHLAIRHSIADRLIVSAFGQYEYRQYDTSAIVDPTNMAAGGPNRTDSYFVLEATADYYLRTWAYCGVSYNLFRNSSNADFRDMAGQSSSASYTKQQVFLRLGVTY